MADLLLATLAVTALVALGLIALTAVTLAPFVLALQMADRRRFSTARWGAVALAGSVVGVLLALLLLRSDRLPTAAAVLPLLLTWLGPLGLWVLSGEEQAGGRAGAHEG